MPSPPLKDLFEPPDTGHIDEEKLVSVMALPLNAQHFAALIYGNFQVALAAHDHRLLRPIFEKILVTAFNFQNRAVRYAELQNMLDCLEKGQGFGTTEIKAERDRHLTVAAQHQQELVNAVMTFREMRAPEDSVS